MSLKMRIQATYNDRLPVLIHIGRCSTEDIINDDTILCTDKKTVNAYCRNSAKVCPRYGKFPCCPPNVPTFDKLKEREYMYVIAAVISNKKYKQAYPLVAESSSAEFLSITNRQRIGKTIINSVCSLEGSQNFKSSYCTGCTYKKDGKCRMFRPALEATGINVGALTSKVLGIEIEYNKAPKRITIVGGIYTNHKLTKNWFKEAISNVTNIKI